MNGEAVKVIAELAEQAASKVVEIDGQMCSARQLFTMRMPEAKPLELHTLSGLCDYWQSGDLYAGDEGTEQFLALHVVSHEEVRIISHLSERTRQRETFATASFVPLLGQTFRFGAWYDAEGMVVSLQTLFEQSEKRDELLNIVGNIRSDASLQVEDDGMTQSVTVKKGIHLATRVALGNPWHLIPWRTFREIEQPSSPFVVRMRGDKDEGISVSIHEADGGAWKNEAIQWIAHYLRTKLGPDVSILA